MCEHPKHYLKKLPSSLHDKIVCDAEAQHGGLFLEAGTTCRFNCSKGLIRNKIVKFILSINCSLKF